MKGKRIAIFGLGRSGLAIAKGALAQGAMPVVLDQTTADRLPKPEILQELRDQGVEAILGWSGELPECDLVVVNPAVDSRSPILRNAVAKRVEVIGEIEFAYRISKAPIVAVTGSNGKSTTAVMTYQCLLSAGERPILCGNIFGSGYPEVPLTEAALTAESDQVLVAEVSSFQLEWVSQFCPVSAGITNITQEHLDRYDRFEDYARTKERIWAAQGSAHFAVMRAHDPVVQRPGGGGTAYRPRSQRKMSPLAADSTPTVLTFGAFGEHAQVLEDALQILDLAIPISRLPFEGVNLGNGAMAALLAHGYLQWRASHDPDSNAATLIREGRELTALADGLRAFRGLAHRMELVGEKDGIRVVNNSMCTNPEALIASVQSLRDPAHILMGGHNKNLDFRPVRNYLANQRHQAYLYGEHRHELNDMLGGQWPTFELMQEAFKEAVRAAKPNQVVILAPGCSSVDQFRDFRHRGDVFREIAKEWLAQ